MRAVLVALGLMLAPGAAWAVEPAEVVGGWVTEWANQGGEAVSGGAPMRISLESPDALDGAWPTPGADGVIFGEAETRADGALVWRGQWAHVWPEGVTRGTFHFVFTDANTFTGTWSTSDGEIVDAAWNGRRADKTHR
jgi:hypothetical protein